MSDNSRVAEYCLVSHQLVPPIRRLKARGSHVIGRDRDCDLTIRSDQVSRRHAELVWHVTGGFIVKDRDSKNGTRVNGVPLLAPQLLKDGDVLEVGNFTLRFRAFEGSMAELLDEEIDGADTADLRTSGRITAIGGRAAKIAFAGGFSDHDLLEVCRVIGGGERTGTLTVRGGSLEGQIAFEKGLVRRARAGEVAGIEAAHELLSLATGRFEFAEGPLSLQPNCKASAEALVMEAARRLDHASPQPRASVSAAEETIRRTAPLLDRAPEGMTKPAAGKLPPKR